PKEGKSMGLFDFLRKPATRPQKPMLATVNSEQRDATGRGPSVAYEFAHRALPSVAFQNPGGFLMSLSDGHPNRHELLKELWKQAARTVSESPEATPPDFAIHPFVLCHLCGICIELPEPQRAAEAYMVAFMAALPGQGRTAVKPLPVFFFTL